MYFRLRSHGSCPGAVAISTCHLCSASPHNQNGAMTNAQALQHLTLWRKNKKQQVRDNTRPTAAFPPAPFSILLSPSSSRYKDPFVRKILFCRSSKVVAERNWLFQSLFLWNWKNALTWLTPVSLKIFFALSRFQLVDILIWFSPWRIHYVFDFQWNHVDYFQIICNICPTQLF